MPQRPRAQARDSSAHLGAFLGDQLREVRQEAGYASQDSIAAGMRPPLDRAVIGRAETGDSPLTEVNLRQYLDLCGISGRLRAVLEGMNRIARIRDDPARIASVPWFETESAAHTLRYWAPTVVPGIAQTPAYAEELFRAMAMSPAQVEEFMAARLQRQAILSREEVPDVAIVIWEHVLHHQIGSREVMREQVARLLEISWLPTVALHVFPASLGANGGLGGAINLAATDGLPELLLSDALVMDQLTQEVVPVRKASGTFSNLRADAHNRADSRTKLMEAIHEWE